MLTDDSFWQNGDLYLTIFVYEIIIYASRVVYFRLEVNLLKRILKQAFASLNMWATFDDYYAVFKQFG